MKRDLSRLIVKSEKVNVEGIEMEIKGLKFPELVKFAKLADGKDYEKISNFLLTTALRNALKDEEMSDEEINDLVNNISSKAALKIINTVRKLSGLDDEETPTETEKKEGEGVGENKTEN